MLEKKRRDVLFVTITPTWLPMVEIMLVDNINVLNVVILPILNGTVPFTNVEHADKQHQDTCHELVMDISMMMESMDIMTLMAMRMEILPENVDLHRLFVLIYFSKSFKKLNNSLIYIKFLSFFLSFHNFQMNCSLCFSLLLLILTPQLTLQPTNPTHLLFSSITIHGFFTMQTYSSAATTSYMESTNPTLTSHHYSKRSSYMEERTK
jgi:hypothetical protein